MSIFSILNHPCSLWFILISLVFSYLSKVLFSGFIQFKGNFVDGQNNSKYRNIAPLRNKGISKPTALQIAQFTLVSLRVSANMAIFNLTNTLFQFLYLLYMFISSVNSDLIFIDCLALRYPTSVKKALIVIFASRDSSDIHFKLTD